MPGWIAYPYDNAAYRLDAATLAERWGTLHVGDAEPLPADPRVLNAWALFHAGDFEQAVMAGLRAAAEGAAGGSTVANRAQLVYASYLEGSEKTKRTLFQEVTTRAQAQIGRQPRDANAHFGLAAALIRSSQSLGPSEVLAKSVGIRIRTALETAIALVPQHADAHLALGVFHAELIDKLGSLLGRTQGASKDAGLNALRDGLRLNPSSAITKIEAASALVMLDGDKRVKEAEKLYADAAAIVPLDAAERLATEMAKTELAE